MVKYIGKSKVGTWGIFMEHGFVKVASATPDVKVADVDYNVAKIKELIIMGNEADVRLLVFPELCVTGYTCGDLFFQNVLLDKAKDAVVCLSDFTMDFDMIVIIGFPLRIENSLYNCAAVLYKGEILGIVPKTYIPTYNGFSEKRYFSEASSDFKTINIKGLDVAFGTNLIFRNDKFNEFSFAVEIGDDLWAPVSPSSYHSLNGANIIVNLSSDNEIIDKEEVKKQFVVWTSSHLVCGYVYANAGYGESTTDAVFAGNNLIAENGLLLNSSVLFENGLTISEIDVYKIVSERQRVNMFNNVTGNYKIIYFNMEKNRTVLTRFVSRMPFISKQNFDFEKILNLQAHALKKRLVHTNTEKVVVGISGGLDSTLALLACIRTMTLLNKPVTNIIAITMPCFGTSDRTKNNAYKLCELLGVTLKEVNIANSVLSHFEDINHDAYIYDVTYENAQARERTQVLMDIANMENAMVIGTGDLSENALGWSTYNGDHMSMYGINSSIPKTLIRYVINYYADNNCDGELRNVLKDILDTPVSPELLPGKEMKQKTEELVGPYELHDFFLYYMIRWNFEPTKILRLAKYAFNDIYDEKVIFEWLKIFYKRFFNSQFKRSCMPDGVKICSVSLSPRGDFKMPSDAMVNVWIKELEEYRG